MRSFNINQQAGDSTAWLKDKERVNLILTQNASKNFVKRIQSPKNYPTLDLGNGDYATHKMAWGTDDKGVAYVYPTVVYDTIANKLIQLDNRAAWQHAVKNNEFIRFDNPADADWFSRKYKAVWGKEYWDGQ
jgi:hypothetical protein